MRVALPLAVEPAFLISAGVFVVFAVIVSVLGLRSDRFAGDTRGGRIVMGLALLITLIAMSSAVLSAESPAQEDVTPLHKPATTAPAPAPVAGGGGGAAASATPAAAAAPAGPATKTVSITADPGTLAFKETAVRAKAGKVTIAFDNPAPIPHNVAIEQNGKKLGETATIANKKATTSLTLKPGHYIFFCAVDGHRQAGMKGVLTVQ